MLGAIRTALTATLLSSVAVAPVATVSFIATTDIAVAKGNKGGNGGGKGGGGGGKSAKAGKKDKSARAGGGQKGGPKATRGKGKGLDKLIGERLFGKKAAPKKVAKSQSVKRSGNVAVAKAGKPEKIGKDGGLHPSELGNMNGALHASENAILAHIRNGNTNGPVGHMAALAVAGYDRDQAEDLLSTDAAREYAAVDDALADATGEGGENLGFETYSDYEDYLANGGAPIDAIDEAVAGIGQAAVDEAVAASEFETLDAYLDAKDSAEGAFDANIELALSESGQYNPSKAETLADAEGAVAGYDDAMAAMKEYWNKGGVDSANAEDLEQMLETRLESYDGVAATIEQSRDADEALADDDCADGADICDSDETALLQQ